MRKEDISAELTDLAFDFFYWFSRFEFCLKENGYLVRDQPGAVAEPDWRSFAKSKSRDYSVSDEAKKLLEAAPKRQVVLANRGLGWRPVDIRSDTSELEKVVCFLKTVRNNLFHGGTHGAYGWDDPDRTQSLLSTSKAVLDQLAKLGDFHADYSGRY